MLELGPWRHTPRDSVHERARADYEAEVAARRERRVEIPWPIAVQRRVLAAILHARPQFAQPLTVQFRDFESLPDEDVTSLLRQLAELGALDDLPPGFLDDAE